MTAAGLVLVTGAVWWSVRWYARAILLMRRPGFNRIAAGRAIILCACGYIVMAAGLGLVTHSYVPAVAISGVAAAVILLVLNDWWRNRRRRAVKLIGEKARQVRARLVRTMRRHPPRPVLRPGRVPA